MNLPSWHYYESHVTIEPVFFQRLIQFKDICSKYKFHVAKLLMARSSKLELSKIDSFCTSRSDDYQDIVIRTVLLVQKLLEEGYEVRRYKIESTLVDSRYDDVFNILKQEEK